jgi:hypothetical protein
VACGSGTLSSRKGSLRASASSRFKLPNLEPQPLNEQQASSNKQQATSETSNLQTLNLENQPLLKTTELQISGILGF